MACKGILKYGLELPSCFTEDNVIMRREVITCKLHEINCPKSRGKCKITVRCWGYLD